MFLFEDEMEVFPMMVFVLYDLPLGKNRDAATFLALSAVWRKIQDKAIPQTNDIVPATVFVEPLMIES